MQALLSVELVKSRKIPLLFVPVGLLVQIFQEIDVLNQAVSKSDRWVPAGAGACLKRKDTINTILHCRQILL